MGDITICRSYKAYAPVLDDGDVLIRMSKRMANALQDDSEFKREATEAIDQYIRSNQYVGEYRTSLGIIVVRLHDDNIVLEFKSERRIQRMFENVFSFSDR